MGNKSGNNSVDRRFRATGTAPELHGGIDTASELRKYGAPKGIRILIVLVTIGDYWDSLVRLTSRFVPIGPNESNEAPVLGYKSGYKSELSASWLAPESGDTFDSTRYPIAR